MTLWGALLAGALALGPSLLSPPAGTLGTSLHAMVTPAPGAGPAPPVAAPGRPFFVPETACGGPGAVDPTCGAGPAPRVGGPNASWLDLAPRSATAPSARCCAASDFDVGADALLLFGGALSTLPPSASNETWAFRGSSWSLLHPAGSPPGALYASMAYDPALGQSVLFGGYDPVREVYLNETWTFANGTWTELSLPVAPAPRGAASLVYDPDLGALVLFGGFSSNATTQVIDRFNDTWTFGPSGWEPLPTPRAPSARTAPSLVPDPDVGGLLLFGGTGSSGTLNDTWTLANGTWTLLTGLASPPPGSGGLAAWDPVGGYAVVFGGANGSANGETNATWAFEGGSWVRVTTPSAPSGRYGAAGAWDPDLGALVAFGGSISYLGTYTNDTWAYFDALSLPGPPAPSAGDASLPVDFSAAPSGGLQPLAYNWSFGDGAVATASAPAHTYATAGTYSVEVAVTDASGASVSRSGSVAIAPYPQAGIDSTPAVPDAGVPTVLAVNVSGGTPPFAVAWTFSDGSRATGLSAPHTFASPGAAVVTAALTDAAGASVTPVLRLYVANAPSLNLEASAGPAEVGLPWAFSAGANGGVPPYSLTWAFGDGSTAEGFSVSHAFASAGNFTVEATLADASGGISQAGLLVPVRPRLSVALLATPVNTDVGAMVGFDAEPTGGIAPFGYAWSFGDGSVGSGSVSSHAFAAPGSYTVTLEATDGRGVGAPASVGIEVNPAPRVHLAGGGSPAAPGVPVTFGATAVEGRAPYGYAWNFGDGSGAAGPAVAHAFRLPGTYRVSVAVTDAANVTVVATASEVVVAAAATAAGVPLGHEVVPLVALGSVALAAFGAVVYLRTRPRPAGTPAPRPPPRGPPAGR